MNLTVSPEWPTDIDHHYIWIWLVRGYTYHISTCEELCEFELRNVFDQHTNWKCSAPRKLEILLTLHFRRRKTKQPRSNSIEQTKDFKKTRNSLAILRCRFHLVSLLNNLNNWMGSTSWAPHLYTNFSFRCNRATISNHSKANKDTGFFFFF